MEKDPAICDLHQIRHVDEGFHERHLCHYYHAFNEVLHTKAQNEFHMHNDLLSHNVFFLASFIWPFCNGFKLIVRTVHGVSNEVVSLERLHVALPLSIART